MATACLIIIEESGAEKAGLYRELDGYPVGAGQDLKYYLSDVSDFSTHRIIALLKDCYQLLNPPDASNLDAQYIYVISIRNGYLNLKVQGLSILYPELPDQSGRVTLYDGDVRDFDPYLADSNWRNQ